MNTDRIFLSALAFASAIFGMTSQDNLKAFLKDGSELTGYVARQRPGQNFTFNTAKATITLPSNDVKSIIDNNIKEANLSPEWQEWAEDNDAYTGVGANRSLILSDILTDKGTIQNVRILERGAKVRYLELKPNAYTLTWDDVEVVKADKRPKLLLSGLNRRYKLASGIEYEGQYIEEVPGQTMSLLRDNGVIEVFNTEDVMKDIRFPINTNQSIFEQSDLIDVLELKNGSLQRGIIFERNYFDKGSNSNDYLLLQQSDGSTVSVPMEDIVEYRKEKNPTYKPVYDIMLSEGKGAINRHIEKFIPVKEKSGILIVDIDSTTLQLSAIVPMEVTAEILLENTKAQQLKFVRIKKYIDKKRKSTYYGFTYEDMVKNAIIPRSVETTVNGVSRLEYILPEDTNRIYGVYNPFTQQILVFKI